MKSREHTDVVSTAGIFEFIELAFHTNLFGLLLIGPLGIGKSSAIAQAARILRVQLIVLDLSLMEPVDLLGIPQIINGRTVYATPDFLPTEPGVILLLEELNRCLDSLRAPINELITSRRIHNYRLPEKTLIMGAMNPDDSDYQVSPIDESLMSRFMKLKVKPDTEGWIKWAEENDVHESLVARPISSASNIGNNRSELPA